MQYWTEYTGHKGDIVGKRKKVDNTIYTLDIETTSYLLVRDESTNEFKQMGGWEYDKLSKKEKDECIKCGTMYLWQLSINENVYYGRTWEELRIFIDKIDYNVMYHKVFFVHNLSFEFQWLKSVFNFTNVLARKSHKVMKTEFEDYDIEFRCSYLMTNLGLQYLPKMYNLDVEKKKGDLDYNKIRHSKTDLTVKELRLWRG